MPWYVEERSCVSAHPLPASITPRVPHLSLSAPAHSRLTPRLLFILAFISAVPPLSIDMYLPGFTEMSRDLGTPASTVQLTLTAFLFGFASGQLVIGTLSDRFGRRRPLLISLAVCTVASIGCAIAPGIALLIALRFVQGFTGAAGVVIGRSIIRDLTEGRAAVKAFSILAAIVSFAPVVAPLLGGTLLPLVSWRGVLGVIAAATLLMTVVIFLFVPESLAVEHRNDGGIGATLRTARALFANRIYVGYLAVLAFTYGAVFAYVSASPFVFQNVFGLSARWYSVAFTFNALGLILASAVNTRIVYRIDPARTLLVAQATLLTVGLLLGTSILTGVATIATVLPLTFLMLTSIGFTAGNSTALAMNAVKHGVGTAAALLGAVQFTFGAVVSPVVGLGGEDTAVPMVAVIMICTSISFLALLVTRHLIAARGREVEAQQLAAAQASLGDHAVQGEAGEGGILKTMR